VRAEDSARGPEDFVAEVAERFAGEHFVNDSGFRRLQCVPPTIQVSNFLFTGGGGYMTDVIGI